MTAFILITAMIIDGILGDPLWLWKKISHPVVMIGRLISICETHRLSQVSERLNGIILIFFLLCVTILIGFLLSQLGPIVEILSAAILLAHKSLIEHVRAVADALRYSVEDGRLVVGKIVGRETSNMDYSDIARATIESAGENLSDGLVAPVFWFLVAGLPGMLAYKAINTADSMIGYRTSHYKEFGWSAARLDDLLNFIPARLTALLICISSKHSIKWQCLKNDAIRHRSPNAGWPEAAMARVLGIALSGPRVYDGKIQEYPFINNQGIRAINVKHIEAAINVMWRTWAILMMLIVVLFILIHWFLT